VKIAFHRQHRSFQDVESSRLRERLAAHEFYDWFAGEKAPAEDIDVLLVVGSLDRATIASQSQLFYIQTASAGYEGIDVDAATEHGIWVSFAPAGETGNAISVAELAIMLMIGASRRLNFALASVRDHGLTSNHVSTALYGKTACIVGLGSVGRALVERLGQFGMTLRGTDGHPERAPHGVVAFPTNQLPDAARDADYVIVCAPSSKDNENLIDDAMLASMKDGAILINVARGALVDEDALAAALQSGHIAAAGLDVLKVEPADPKNPLLALPQALITPHIAGSTDVMLVGTFEYLVNVIEDLVAGKRPHSVVNVPEHPRRALS
jgi:phosphoglycerate dehydrogenase-like enzyme